MTENPMPARPLGRGEAAIPAAILLFRLAIPRTPWIFDWILVLSVYWMLLVFLTGRKARLGLTVGAMILLVAMYLFRVCPILVDTLWFCL